MSSMSSDRIRDALTDTALKVSAGNKRTNLASVRSSPGAYLALAAVATFLSLVLLRGQYDFAALALIISTWIAVPLLVLTDRLNFDGQTLSRRGLIAALSRIVRGRTIRIAIDEIEGIEISALRTLRRGGSVRYRYRVEVTADQMALVFSSGGKKFRRMTGQLLPVMPDAKLDARALELRDHLVDPKRLRSEAKQLGIASTMVLDASDLTAHGKRRLNSDASARDEMMAPDFERGRSLRKAANDLRVAGRLRESAEAFRRALLITPRDAPLIYEYARLLKSQASALGDASLRARARAALRLAAMRDRGDADLSTRIGESFLEHGNPERARKSFQRALEIDERAFRAQLGLAEASLSEGKLAHVIHHFGEAARIAPDKATARLARREADYYSRLNDDEDYLAAELRRMNWLQNAARIQQLAARASFASLLLALTGSSINQFVAGVGWALASSSIIAWSASLIATRLLATRRKSPALS